MTREQKLQDSSSSTQVNSKRHARLRNVVLGLLSSTSISLTLARLFRHVHGDDIIPLLFLVVIGLIAHFLGTLSAIVELISAGYVFATFLFAPLGSWTIMDESARTNLILMLLFGLAISYFYGGEDNREEANPPARDG
jgi:K+-sensing histidine kinase KdpD